MTDRRTSLAVLLSAAIALPVVAAPASATVPAGPAGVAECRNGWQELIIPDTEVAP